MLDDDALNAIADRMLSDYDAVTPGTIFAEDFRLDLDDAWRVQTAVTRLREARGEKVVGYKVGCVSPGNQNMMGLAHPVWGRLWDSELHAEAAALKKADHANIAIEAEFGIVLSRDIVTGQSVDEYAASIKAVYPLLELHNLVMRGQPPHGHELIANNCINCGVVPGAAVTQLTAPLTTDLKLIYDGNVVDQWPTLRWPNDILASLEWLTGSLEQHHIQLRAGDLVLTGAWGPPIPVEDYTRVEVTSSAFGDASATFT